MTISIVGSTYVALTVCQALTSALYTNELLYSQQSSEGGTVTIPTLQMRKPRPREGKRLAQGHTEVDPGK